MTQLNKLLYSKEEAADLIGVSKHTISRDILRGVIASRQYGRRRLVPAEEILRIATEGMAPKAQSAA
jgi:excisionase family DNA binding protein